MYVCMLGMIAVYIDLVLKWLVPTDISILHFKITKDPFCLLHLLVE
jgi:hypothetical protein